MRAVAVWSICLWRRLPLVDLWKQEKWVLASSGWSGCVIRLSFFYFVWDVKFPKKSVCLLQGSFSLLRCRLTFLLLTPMSFRFPQTTRSHMTSTTTTQNTTQRVLKHMSQFTRTWVTWTRRCWECLPAKAVAPGVCPEVWTQLAGTLSSNCWGFFRPVLRTMRRTIFPGHRVRCLWMLRLETSHGAAVASADLGIWRTMTLDVG